MSSRATEKFFSFIRRIFFEEISSKFRAGSFKNLVALFYVIFEKTAYKFDVISSYYLKMYNEIVEKEIRMANISPEDFVLVIGGGSLPATSILIALKTRAKIVSIDKDQRAIKKSSNLINTLNLENRVKFEHADGLYYPIKKFDVIFILYGVKKKKEILNYLSYNMKETARVVLRTVPDPHYETKADQIGLSILFNVKNHVQSESLGPVCSFLLFKKI